MRKLLHRKSKVPVQTEAFGIKIPTKPISTDTNGERRQMYAPDNGRYGAPQPKLETHMWQIIDSVEDKVKQQKDEELRRQREQDSTKERIRALREMIREKRRLDIEIWSDRGVQEYDREDVMEVIEQADALQDKICDIVDGWHEAHFTPEEWIVVGRIKKGMTNAAEQYVPWRLKLPWDREEPEDMYKYGWR